MAKSVSQNSTNKMGYLTTHVLDTARGQPAAGITIVLYKINEGSRRKIASAITNHDGRTDSPILPKENFAIGKYELVFSVATYLEKHKLVGKKDEPLFLEEIPIRFGINDVDAHYHVPLLLSPYGYSTYRGS